MSKTGSFDINIDDLNFGADIDGLDDLVLTPTETVSSNPKPKAKSRAKAAQTRTRVTQKKIVSTPMTTEKDALGEIDFDDFDFDDTPTPSLAPTPASVTSQSQQKYVVLSDKEHLRKRKEVYLGEVTNKISDEFVYDVSTNTLSYESVTYNTGLLKLFDEVFTNAIDNYQRTKSSRSTNQTKNVNVNIGTNYVSVLNDGESIPITKQTVDTPTGRREMYIPEIIFTLLRSGSNFDDTSSRTWGGMNGMGCKIVSYLSDTFIIEVMNGNQYYFQHVAKGADDIKSPIITYVKSSTELSSAVTSSYKTVPQCKTLKPNTSALTLDGFVRITYFPTFNQFMPDSSNETSFTDSFQKLMQKRVYDVCYLPINLSINETKVPTLDWKQFAQAHANCIPTLAPNARTRRKKQTRNEDGETETPANFSNDTLITYTSRRGWQVAISTLNQDCKKKCPPITFVNYVSTHDGGTHLTYVLDQLSDAIKAKLAKTFAKGKSASALEAISKSLGLRDKLFICISAIVPNPRFASQAKEKLTSHVKDLAKMCDLPITTLRQVVNDTSIIAIIEGKKVDAASKSLKKVTVNSIEKAKDATFAGTARASETRLILTEGDSALTTAVNGVESIPHGLDYYGMFPLRGKMLNVKKASQHMYLSNVEMNNIKILLGIEDGKEYTEASKLRYGGVILMTDADTDGADIKGLAMNFFETKFPSLLKIDGFISEFITPMIKITCKPTCELICKYGDDIVANYRVYSSDDKVNRQWFASDTSMPTVDIDEPVTTKRTRGTRGRKTKSSTTDTPEASIPTISFDGLDIDELDIIDGLKRANRTSTSTSKSKPKKQEILNKLGKSDLIIPLYNRVEFEKFKNAYLVNVSSSGYEIDYIKGLGTIEKFDTAHYFQTFVDNNLKIVFDQFTAEKMWLAFSAGSENARKAWIGKIDDNTYLKRESGKPIQCSEFIDTDLCLYSYDACVRAIPSVADGLKPTQRKILAAMLNMGKKAFDKIKVTELGGLVTKDMKYEHGDTSMNETIVNMAQDYPGSNNLNLLIPLGQFGSRRQNGADHAAYRYIHTKLNKLARLIFPEIDDNVLEYRYDEGAKTEPVYYVPIIPMVLVNGAVGVGVGWSTTIPTFDIKELIRLLIERMDTNEPITENDLPVCFNGFKGTVEHVQTQDGLVSVPPTPKSTVSNGSASTDSMCHKWIVKGAFTMKDCGDGTYEVKVTDYPIVFGSMNVSVDKLYSVINKALLYRETKEAETTKAAKASARVANKRTVEKASTPVNTFGEYDFGGDDKETNDKDGDEKNRVSTSERYIQALAETIVQFTPHKHTSPEFTLVIDKSKLIPKGMSEENAPALFENLLKMNKSMTSSNMTLFNRNNVIKRYKSISGIIAEWRFIRRNLYVKRIHFQLEEAKKQLMVISNKYRFIKEIVDETLVVSKRPKTDIENDLSTRQPPYDKLDGNYNYLLNMPIHSLTKEKLEELANEKKKVEERIEYLSTVKIETIWKRELQELLTAYTKYELEMKK